MESFGNNFLKKKYNNLHTSEEVLSAQKRTEKRTGEELSSKPEVMIENYLNRFEEILKREDPKEKEQGIRALKKILHNSLIIKEENIPFDYFLEQEQSIAERQGHGRPEATPDWRDAKKQEIQEGQRRSLDTWIDYLASPDALYPMWAKYWAFRSMTQMGGYNKKEGRYSKRTEKSSQPFPTLNIACLAKTIDVVQRQVEITGLPKDSPERTKKEKELSYALNHDSEYRALLSSENFAKLYTYALEQFSNMSWKHLENIAGRWKVYEQGSEPDELYDSLQGYPLEWCTATNIETARTQLEGGNFHVYYSQDDQALATIPRLAIRMTGSSIAEVRGIEKDQNIDQFIQPILDDKLKGFGREGDKYLKKSEDMKRMTLITEKHRAGQELSEKDLRFLYQLDGEIQGFGYQEDPRIAECLSGRNKKEDLAKIFDCRPDQIAETQKEALSGDIVYYGENLYLDSLRSAEGLILPEHIGGILDLRSLTSAEGLILPEHIGGSLYLDSLRSAEGLILPEHFKGSLNLSGLTSAEGLTLPRYIGGSLLLNRLASAEGLILPEHVGGDIYLDNLSEEEKEKLREQYPQYREKNI